MNKNENYRNLLFFIAILSVVIICCVSNIVKLNVFALTFDIILLIFVCFTIGYNYSRYESQIDYGVVLKNEIPENDVVVEVEEDVKIEPVIEETQSDEETLTEAVQRIMKDFMKENDD